MFTLKFSLDKSMLENLIHKNDEIILLWIENLARNGFLLISGTNTQPYIHKYNNKEYTSKDYLLKYK